MVLSLLAAVSALALDTAPLASSGADQPIPQGSATEAKGPPATTPAVRQGDTSTPAQQRQGAAAGAATPALAPLDASSATAGERSVQSFPRSYFDAQNPNSAGDMIDRLPGFSFDGGNSVRGFDGAAGNVLIDGARPTSKNDDLYSILVRVPASTVERIDVIRGGAPGIDMQGRAVIANVVRKKGAATTGVLGFSDQLVVSDGRTVPAIRFELSRRADGQVLEGSIVAAGFADDGAGDGQRVRRNAQGRIISVADNKTEGDGTQVTATAAYQRPLFGGVFRINGSLFHQAYTYDDRAAELGPAPYSLEVERDHQNRENGELGVNWTKELSPKYKIELLALQTVKGEDYLSLYDTAGERDRFREQHGNSESIGRGVLTWRASRRLTIEGGGEGAYNILNGHSSFSVNGAGIPLPSAKVDVTELRGEAFVKANWTATRTLTVEAALRGEISRIESTGSTALGKTLAYPKPRLALAWSPTKTDQFRVRVEREVGQLNFNDFVASSSLNTGQILSGNPNLVPQQSWVVEGAYERQILGSGSVSLTLRHAELTDVVDRAPIFSGASVFDSPANIGDGTRDDLIVAATIPLDRLGVKGFLIKPNLSLTRSEVVDPTTGKAREISGLRPYDLDVKFSHDLPKWHISYGGEVFSGFRERYFRFNQVETDQFRWLGSMFLEYKPKGGIQYRVEAREIGAQFDRRLSVYNGARTTNSLNFYEARTLSFGPIFYFRIRKTW